MIGTREEMGKGVGTDDTKNTFVRLHGLDACAQLVEHYTQEAIQSLDAFQDTSYMIHLAHSLTVRRN